MKSEWADLSTGEVVADAAIIAKARYLRGPAARSPFGNRWCKMSMVALPRMVKLGLGILELRIFMHVVDSIRDGNMIDVNQTILARELESHQANVSKALGNLVQANVLDRTDGAGRFTVYRISPHLAWYGADNHAHREACKIAPPLRELPPKPAKPRLDSALRKIAAHARAPIAMTTGSAMLVERTIVRDDYSDPSPES